MTLKAELPVFPEGVYTPPEQKPKYPPWPTNFGKYPPWKFWSFPLPGVNDTKMEFFRCSNPGYPARTPSYALDPPGDRSIGDYWYSPYL